MLFASFRNFFVETIESTSFYDTSNNEVFIDKDWFFSHSMEAPKIILSHLEEVGLLHKLITEDNVICDLGCGDGIMIASLNEMLGTNAIGLDYNEVNLPNLKSNFNHYNMNLNDKNLKFFTLENYNDKNKFDFILSWSVVEHVENLENYIQDLKSMLKDGGIAYIQTWPLWNSAYGHHLMGVVNPYEHLIAKTDVDFINGLEKYRKGFSRNDYVNFDEWKIEAIKSYRSCNRVSFDLIHSTIVKNLKLLYFKPIVDQIGFNFRNVDIDFKENLLSGGHWIAIKDKVI